MVMPTVQDFENGKEDLDDLAALISEKRLVQTRYGQNPKKSFPLLMSETKDQIDQVIREVYQDRTPVVKGEFATGFTYAQWNDVGLDSAGNPWIYNGPGKPDKVVPAGTIPAPPTYVQVMFNDAGDILMPDGRTVESEINTLKSFIEESIKVVDNGGNLLQVTFDAGTYGTVVYVKHESNDQNADIYKTEDGSTPIVQDGVDNKTDLNGHFTFAVAKGSYYLLVGVDKHYFKVGNLASNINWNEVGTTAEDVGGAGNLNAVMTGDVVNGGYQILASKLGIYGIGPDLDAKCKDAIIKASERGATLVLDRDVTFNNTIQVTAPNINVVSSKGVTVKFLNGGFLFENSYSVVTESVVSIIDSYFPGTPYLPGTVIAGLSSTRIKFSSANHGLAKGDVIKLGSDTLYPWITLNAKAGQSALVAFVEGADVWLDREIELGYNYTKIFKLGEDSLNVSLKVANYDDTTPGGTLVYIRNYVQPQAEIVVPHSNYQAVVSAGNVEANIKVAAANIRNFNASKTKWGYGLIDKNSENSTYLVYCAKLRHGYTTTHGGGGTTPDCYGQPRHNVISGRGVNCITPFDTHASGFALHFKDCQSMYSLGVGFANRSSETVYENCHTLGTSDSGWQNFDGENANVAVGHNRKVTLINCSSKGHKRSLKSISNTKKDTEAHRFEVILIDCIFEADTYTECMILRNTTLRYNNLKIKNLSSSSSVTESSWSEENPIFIRSYVRLINSSFVGEDLKLVAGGNGLNIYPFAVSVDRSQDPDAMNTISTNGIYLDNSKHEQFQNFAELVISYALNGKKPSDGPLDYVAGLEYSYLAIEGLSVHTKNLGDLMRDDVLAFFANAAQITKNGFYYFNTKPPMEFVPLYRLANDDSIFNIGTHTDNDYLDAKRTIDLKHSNCKKVTIRCLPITPSGQTGEAVIDITEIKNPGGPECIGVRLDIINERPTGKVKITAPNIIPADQSVKGAGLVMSLIYNGYNKFVRVS